MERIDLMEKLHQNYNFENRDFFRQDFIILNPMGADGARPKFWFYLSKETSQRILYKAQNEGTYESYGELIGEAFANIFDIKCAHYELAKFDLPDSPFSNTEGVITFDFLNKNEQLIPMADIISYVLTNYPNFNYKNEEPFIKLYRVENIDNFKATYKLNNLEDIWSILDIYLKNHPKFSEWEKEKINKTIKNIMNKLVNVVLFDIITLQGDRHACNFSLLYNKDKQTFDLAPLYDNSNIFGLNRISSIKTFNELMVAKNKKPEKVETRIYNAVYKPKMQLSVSESDFLEFPVKFGKKQKQLDILKRFLRISSIEYLELLEKYIKIIEQIGIETIVNSKGSLPIEVQKYIIAVNEINISSIKEIIQNERERGKKR